MGSRPQSLFLLTLIVTSALGPAAMQIFLPALPAVQADFEVGYGTAQLALSLAMLSMGVSTLAYGPLSDRYGRKPVLLSGLAVFLAGTLACALASNIWLLIAGRVVQAGGGVAGLVLARAAVRDRYGRDESASMIAYITMAMVLAPMLAPSVGGLLTDHFGWRATFIALSAVALVLLPLVITGFHETRAASTAAESTAGILQAMGRLLRSPLFLAYAGQAGFAMSVFFAFISAAPYLVIEVLGRPATAYGVYFMFVAGGYIVGNFISGRISVRVGVDRMMVLGSVLTLAGTLVLAVLVVLVEWSPLSLFAPTAFVSVAQGLSLPSSQAGAVSVDPALAGTASGLASFMHLALAALVSQCVGILQDGTPVPMVSFMLAGALLSLTASLVPARLAARA